jgi:ABC-type uncharacterized transport system substrate-binding protein
MNRRAAMTLLGGAVAAWPLAARAQQMQLPVVAFLQRSSPIRSDFGHFRDGLARLGYEAGRNIRIEQRYANGSDTRLSELVQDIANLNPAVVVVDGSTTISAMQAASKTIPIVATVITDPDATSRRKRRHDFEVPSVRSEGEPAKSLCEKREPGLRNKAGASPANADAKRRRPRQLFGWTMN